MFDSQGLVQSIAAAWDKDVQLDKSS